jgi:uncharacterized protein
MKNLGFGFMRLPLLNPNDQASVDAEQLNKMVDTFLERGFTYFDTAYMYHNHQSEIALRESLVKRHKRDEFTLATKMPTMFLKSKDDNEKFFNEQLEKCGVDYFDYYLIHNLNISLYDVASKFDAFSFLRKMKSEGKIKHLGFSYHDNAGLLDKILTEHPEMEFVQLQLNYLDWDNESIQSRKCYEVARKHNKPVIAMEPVKGGTLAKLPPKAEQLFRDYNPDLSIPSWAIRFIAGHEGIMMVLSGMSDYGQLLDNTGYMQEFIPFLPEEYDLIKKAVDIINETNSIPCTACRYCVEGCPENIDIPKYFALYNTEMLAPSPTFSIPKLYYFNYTKTYGKASQCSECRQCEDICPQHIEITNHLKDVVKIFETN